MKCGEAGSSRLFLARFRLSFVQAQARKKGITGSATINGIGTSMRSSEEMTAKVRAAA
jgi:hypothetical protein